MQYNPYGFACIFPSRVQQAIILKVPRLIFSWRRISSLDISGCCGSAVPYHVTTSVRWSVGLQQCVCPSGWRWSATKLANRRNASSHWMWENQQAVFVCVCVCVKYVPFVIYIYIYTYIPFITHVYIYIYVDIDIAIELYPHMVGSVLSGAIWCYLVLSGAICYSSGLLLTAQAPARRGHWSFPQRQGRTMEDAQGAVASSSICASIRVRVYTYKYTCYIFIIWIYNMWRFYNM